MKQKGFTLVEVIVVLVILAILAAILIPSFIGYINKANKNADIAQCRQAVLATQTLASENYNTNNTDYLKPPYNEIKKLSEVSGTINEVRVENGKVTYLKFTNKYVVIFENDKYRIEGESEDNNGNDEDNDNQNNDNSITITDSSGTDHILNTSMTIEEFKNQLDNSDHGMIFPKGTIIKDSTGTYAVGWNTYINNPNNDDYSLDSISNMIKLNDKIYTDSDKNNGQWTSNPNKGDISFYNNKYYIAPGDLNSWTFPPGGWVELKPGT